MNSQIKDILSKNNVSVELKGYKEMPSSDGYHMRGNLYVNGKKSIFFEDLGLGGECDIEILNSANAEPLLKLIPEFNKVKPYIDREPELDTPYELETLFYELAEDLLLLKDLKRRAKKGVLIKFKNEKYDKGSFSFYKYKMSYQFLDFIIKKLKDENMQSVEIFNFDNEFKKYSINDLKNISKTIKSEQTKIKNH